MAGHYLHRTQYVVFGKPHEDEQNHIFSRRLMIFAESQEDQYELFSEKLEGLIIRNSSARFPTVWKKKDSGLYGVEDEF